MTERPAANLREWREAAASAHELVRLCKACLEPQTTEKKHPLDQLLDFFPGPVDRTDEGAVAGSVLS